MLLWLKENWSLIVELGILLIIAIVYIIKFIKLPKEIQKEKIKGWFLYAVTEAEKDMGSKTGELKRNMVYDMFKQKFPIIATLISYDTFREWIDVSLVDMKEMLASNPNASDYVNNK